MPVLILYSSRSTLKFLLSFGIYPTGRLVNGATYFMFCLSIQVILCDMCSITLLILCFLLCVSAVWYWCDHFSAKLQLLPDHFAASGCRTGFIMGKGNVYAAVLNYSLCAHIQPSTLFFVCQHLRALQHWVPVSTTVNTNIHPTDMK